MTEAAASPPTDQTSAASPAEGAGSAASSLLGAVEQTAETEKSAAPGGDEAAPDKSAEPGDKAAAEADKPIEYTDFTMPEGMALDANLLGQFTPIAKELKLGQEQAQKLVTLYAEQQKAAAAASVKAWGDQQKAWETASRSDKEFGGDGLDANLAVAKQALDKFGTPELKAYLDAFGGGNHPEVIRFFYRIGKAVSEDTFHAGSAPGRAADPAHILFPNDAPKGN